MNYRIMIVDDEPIFRNTIKKIISEHCPGYTVVHTAADGQEALEYMTAHPVEIVITDIKMPRMDGIQLVTHLAQNFPSAAIAVLSAYEDYPLIRAAFKCGAADYLLKMEIDAVSIEKLLASLAKRLANLGQNRTDPDGSTSSKQIYQSLRQQFHQWMYGSTATEEEIRRYLTTVSRKVEGPCYRCILMEADAFAQTASYQWDYNQELLHFACMNILEELFLVGGQSAVFPFEYDRFAILCACDASHVLSADALTANIHKAQALLQEHLHLTFSYGISQANPSVPCLRQMVKEAQQALETGSLVFIPHPDQHETEQKLAGFPPVFSEILFKASPETLLQEVMDQLPKAADISEALFSDYLSMYDRLQIILNNYCDRMNFQHLKVRIFQDYQSLKKQPKRYLYRYEAWLSSSLEAVIKEKSEYNSIVMAALTMMEERYDQDLSLEKVAQQLFITPSYLSRLFKKHTGNTFSDALNEIRIKKADALLQTGTYKVWEIAQLVGFHSVEYFSRVYRKRKGHSPRTKN